MEGDSGACELYQCAYFVQKAERPTKEKAPVSAAGGHSGEDIHLVVLAVRQGALCGAGVAIISSNLIYICAAAAGK